MKKIFTSVFVLALATGGFSQSLHIFESGVDITGTTVYDTVDAYESNLHDLEIHNMTTSAVTYQVNRTILNPPMDADAQLYFCTGVQCYSPQSATTWTPSGPPPSIAASSTLPAGPGTYGIAAHYNSGAMPNTLRVLYRLYNTATSGDTAFVTIVYVSIYAGIEENKLAAGNISAAFPNPASSFASIKYDMNQFANKGRIAFYDMLGNKVKEVELSDKQGIAKVDVSDFNSGIYFYSFIVNDKAIATKKMVVSAR